MEFLKRLFCRHGNMKIVEDYTWVCPGLGSTNYYNELRKYLVCPKCGYKRKVSKK